MLVHTVYFWLKPTLSDTEREAFNKGVESLTHIESATAVYLGTPAATEARPVIDASYDIALTVLLEDIAAHDAYQVDPIHTDFIGLFKPYWEKVQIYDAD